MLTRYSNNGSQREHAYNQLRELLILKQLSEGTRLSESEWTDRLNVNRSALREAFVRLESEGLIEAGRKGGYTVPALTVEDFQEILAVRFGLESVGIDLICQRGFNTQQQMKPVQEVCELFERLLTEEYRLSVVEADRRFHELLVTTSRNKRLLIAYLRTPLPIIRPDLINTQKWEERVRRVAKQHREILKNLRAGDANLAKKSLRIHMEDDLQDMAAKTRAGRSVKLGMRTKR